MKYSIIQSFFYVLQDTIIYSVYISPKKGLNIFKVCQIPPLCHSSFFFSQLSLCCWFFSGNWSDPSTVLTLYFDTVGSWSGSSLLTLRRPRLFVHEVVLWLNWSLVCGCKAVEVPWENVPFRCWERTPLCGCAGSLWKAGLKMTLYQTVKVNK